MGREIKFRAYTPDGMVQVKRIDFEQKWAVFDNVLGEQGFSIEEFPLIKYAGLKDKNGVAIYEGDIVKTCEGNLQQVIWKDNGFKLLYEFNVRGYDEKNILDLGDTSSRRWGVEVIGNIFDNPELLEAIK